MEVPFMHWIIIFWKNDHTFQKMMMQCLSWQFLTSIPFGQLRFFFWKPLPYFTSNEQLTDEALEQCINIFFFKRNCSQLLAGRHVSNKEVIFGDSVLCVMLKYMYHKNQSMQFIRGKKVNVFIARWTLTLDCRNLF